MDIRVDANGQPFMLEINSMASLGWGGAYVMSARQAGMSFSELVCGIVDDAHRRYFGTPAARSVCDAACETDSAMIA